MKPTISLLVVLGLLTSPQVGQPPAKPWFLEVNHSGLEGFRHVSGGPLKKFIFEATSGGVCVFDFDRDGWMDIYLVNGGHLDLLDGRGDPVFSRLFRNNQKGSFEDVTERVGVSNAGSWGQGCSAADFDNDGWVDLYVTNLGPNRLYRNRANGSFADEAVRAGVADARWSTGAAWGDYDNDGDLDLYVANYVELNPKNLPLSAIAGGPVEARFCEFRGEPVFCGPRGLRGAPDALYRNNGDGTFTNVTEASGMGEAVPSYGFTAVWFDADRDGFLDLFVANDSTPNYLYRSRHDGTFEEIGYLAGVALNQDGREQAFMGVAVGDYDRNSFLDIFITTFSHDSYTLFGNQGKASFEDMTYATGLAEPTIPYLGWGTFFFDYDNDGDLDLFAANGHVYPQVDTWSSQTTYRQRKQLFENVGGRFREVSKDVGEAIVKPDCARGAAFLDYDNDGWLDIVVNNLDGQPTLLRNELDLKNHYLTLRLLSGKRDAIGAQVALRTGNHWQYGEVSTGASYLSQNDPRLHFGLGKADVVDEIRVRWPSGQTTSYHSLKPDQILTLSEPREHTSAERL